MYENRPSCPLKVALLAAVAVIALTTAACGSEQDLTAGADPSDRVEESTTLAPEAPVAPSSTAPSLPDSPEQLSVPEFEDPQSRLAANDNVRDGGLGSLCWARWEVARHLLMTLVSDSQRREAMSGLASRIDSVEDELRGIDDAARSEFGAFTDRLRSDLSDAKESIGRGEDSSQILNAFDFERYPDVETYLAAAERHQACVTP